MKKIIVLIMCFLCVVTPCFAIDEVSEPLTESPSAKTSSKNTTSEITPSPKKIEQTTKASPDVTEFSADDSNKSHTSNENNTSDDVETPEREDMSQPRLMVTSYQLESGFIAPNKKKTVTVNLKNMHSDKAVKNIKLSLSEDEDEIRPTGMGTQYVSYISAGGYYCWDVELSAVNIASIGEHKLIFTAEYEDTLGSGYSSSDILRVEVRQPAKLIFDGAKLPAKVIQDDTVTLNIKLMNTGKSTLYNCKADFDIKGLDSGGSSYVGEIQPQESSVASANLLVSGTKLGTVKGKIKITYEDAFGKEYTLTQSVSTQIEKKIVKATQSENEESEKKNPLWWLFILIGLAAGGSLGFFIPYGIRARKERLRDEERL